MLTEYMTASEKISEFKQDINWLNSMSQGWNKKYAKSLKLYQTKYRVLIDKHIYETPNRNRVHAFFVCERVDWGKKVYNNLVFYYVWEMLRRDGRKDYFLINSFDENNYVGCKNYLQISAHANDRMKMRSGKDVLEIYESTICETCLGCVMTHKYDYNNRDNDIYGRFGNGMLLGIQIECGCSLMRTYIDWNDEYVNQNLLHLKSKIEAEQRGDEVSTLFDEHTLTLPKSVHKERGYIRVR